MNDINETIGRQREYFGSGATRPVEFRREMLKALRTALERHEEELYAALYEDLHKGREEAFLTELSIVYQEISAHLRGVARWSRRRSVRPALQV
ncbi:MAG: aldehyde dehydrogenase, partial [bacterium]|nr:aldehyde dehydrogenase [Candidatus Aphodosoma intestinipullorum]